MKLPMHVVIVGPGALGLGLIGSLAGQAGLEMSLLARHGSDAKPDIVKRHLQRRGQYVVLAERFHQTVSGFQLYWSDVNASSERLLGNLASLHADILICTTLGPAQGIGAKFINDLMRRRSTRTPGIVIVCPCENTVADSLASIHHAFRESKHLLYADAMVDRFCKRPIVGRRGIVSVPVGDEYEWAISLRHNSHVAASNMARVIDNLKKLDVSILSDVSNTKERKTLMCNGVHFCSALLAMPLGHTNLASFFATPAGRDAVESLTVEFAKVWSYLQPKESPARIHGLQDWYLRRMLKNDHDVEVVLRNLTAGRPADFVRDTLNKVETAFQVLLDNDREAARNSMMLRALMFAAERHQHMLSKIEE